MYLPTFTPLGADDAFCAPEDRPACVPTAAMRGPELAPSQIHNSTQGTLSQPPQTALGAAAETGSDGGDAALIGARNTLGVALAAAVIIATVALWLAFGKWPRRQWKALRHHRVRKRAAARGGGETESAEVAEHCALGAGCGDKDARVARPDDILEKGTIMAGRKDEEERSGDISEERLVGTYVRVDLC
ncbi:hypothetical protein SCP_0111550 [Sparassis crispa]|uniref:Uncharacterized protein n=1 Tax=Sparassis crispa TaxID=139825 RepID=A0A401G7Y2_9APHY|nr:hypothetical protein SCP_0111550 [Sparassis crispa]GBE78272.1 hypothetical protein SCP_0111550 [Sparassis crispa]